MRNNKDRSDWSVGGGVILGLGIGLILLPDGLAFVGSLLAGLGLGLLVSSLVGR